MKTSFLARLLIGGGTLTSIGAFPNIVKIATEKSGTKLSGRKIRSIDSKGQQLSGSLWDNIQINGQELRFAKEYCFYYNGGDNANIVKIVGLPKKGINRNQCWETKGKQDWALKDRPHVELEVEIPISSVTGEGTNLLVWGAGSPAGDGQVLGCIDTQWWRKEGHKNNNGIIVWDSFLRNGGTADCAHRMYVGHVATRQFNSRNGSVTISGVIGEKWKKVENNGGVTTIEGACRERKEYRKCTEKIVELWTKKWTQDWNEVKNKWGKYGTIGSEKITWTLKQK